MDLGIRGRSGLCPAGGDIGPLSPGAAQRPRTEGGEGASDQSQGTASPRQVKMIVFRPLRPPHSLDFVGQVTSSWLTLAKQIEKHGTAAEPKCGVGHMMPPRFFISSSLTAYHSKDSVN